MHRERSEERAGASELLGMLFPPKSPHVHQPGSSLNLILLDFYGGFITKT